MSGPQSEHPPRHIRQPWWVAVADCWQSTAALTRGSSPNDVRRALRAALALQDAPQSMFERLLLRGYRLDLARGLRAARPAIAPEAHDALGRLANWLEASKVEAPELIVAVQDVLELLEECGRAHSDEQPVAPVG